MGCVGVDEGGWRQGALVSSNLAAKEDGCNMLLLIRRTHEHKVHKCAFSWVSGVWVLFFVYSPLNLWTNYRHYWLQKRLPHTEPRPWHVPLHCSCSKINESQKSCWCVSLLSTGFLGFDASQVVERILRWPLRIEMGEVNIVIWPDWVATCFGCGLLWQSWRQQMAFDVRVKRFGGISERLRAVLRWD